MLTPINQTEIIKRFKPPGEPPPGSDKTKSGGITLFPNAPLDMPTETFTKALNKREENRKALLRWMRQHFREGIEFGRIHLDERCRYARAGNPALCRDISHYSRPMLYKAGAERIIAALGLTARFPNLEQYEKACVFRQEVSQIIIKCELHTQNGAVVSEGTGGRHIRQDNWSLNTSIKMAVKSALVDAVIRVSALSGVFIKTHQHTLTRLGDCHQNTMPVMSGCNRDNFHGRSDCNFRLEKPMTPKQQNLIQHAGGKRGYNSDSLNSQCQDLFRKHLNDLNRVEASRFIKHLINKNG